METTESCSSPPCPLRLSPRGSQGDGDSNLPGSAHLRVPAVVCERGCRDARSGAEGAADAGGGAQADGRQSGADGGRAEAGRPPAPAEGEGDAQRVVPPRHALLQSEGPHPDEPHLQTAAEDAER